MKISKNKVSIVTLFLFFVSVIGVTNFIIFKKQSYLGNEYFGIYFLFSIFLVYLSIKYLHLNFIRQKIILTFLFFKIPITLFLMYLFFTRYGGGDLQGYYFQVVDSIFSNSFSFHFSGVQAVQSINYLFFQIFPNSLWGMSLIYASLSFIAYLILFKIFYQYSFNRKYLFILLFFIPTIAMQSSFFGKDGYALLMLNMIFASFYMIYEKNKRIYWIILAISLLLLGAIRLYQLAFVVVALYLFFISRNKISFIIGSIFALILSIFVFNIIISTFLSFSSIDNFNFSKALSVAYTGGSLMLDPFPVPLNMLQIFRPFPWEANNAFLFLASIEKIVVLLFLLFLFKKYYKQIVYRIKNISIYRFLFFYTIVVWFIFSFDTNMGDLLRRNIYILPYLVILVV